MKNIENKIEKKKEELTIQVDPTKVIKHTVSYYNFVIFIVIVSVALIASVIILANTFLNPVADNVNPATPGTNVQSTFDQSTIDKLGRFETSDKNVNFTNDVGGRSDPFSE